MEPSFNYGKYQKNIEVSGEKKNIKYIETTDVKNIIEKCKNKAINNVEISVFGEPTIDNLGKKIPFYKEGGELKSDVILNVEVSYLNGTKECFLVRQLLTTSSKSRDAKKNLAKAIAGFSIAVKSGIAESNYSKELQNKSVELKRSSSLDFIRNVYIIYGSSSSSFNKVGNFFRRIICKPSHKPHDTKKEFIKIGERKYETETKNFNEETNKFLGAMEEINELETFKTKKKEAYKPVFDQKIPESKVLDYDKFVKIEEKTEQNSLKSSSPVKESGVK